MSHIERMKDELGELREKLDALDKFIKSSPIYKALPVLEQDDLGRQRFYMDGYVHILSRRLERAEDSK